MYECGDDISHLTHDETVVIVNHQSPTDIGTIMRIFQVRETSCMTYESKMFFFFFVAEVVESRTQGSKPRPRTQKNPRPRTDPLEAKNRNARDQGHRRKCSPKKKGLQNFFSGEKGLQKFFLGDLPIEENKKKSANFSARFLTFSNKILTIQKILLSLS